MYNAVKNRRDYWRWAKNRIRTLTYASEIRLLRSYGGIFISDLDFDQLYFSGITLVSG